ncbi:MAG TPA: hypothetical protein VGH27_02705 [Streptosporangiaceae bacterium]|jgi:hypothetical protein
MPRHARSLLLTAATAILAVGLAVPPAGAATQTWTVEHGGLYVDLSDHGPRVTDVTDNTQIGCAGNYWAAVAFKNGTGLTSQLGDVRSIKFPSCHHSVFTHLAPLGLPWTIHGAAYDPATGVVTGQIRGIHLRLTGDSCSAVIDGTAADADDGATRFTYANPAEAGDAGTLTIKGPAGGDLHAYDVTGSGCGGVLNDGDLMWVYLEIGVINYSQNAAPQVTSP